MHGADQGHGGDPRPRTVVPGMALPRDPRALRNSRRPVFPVFQPGFYKGPAGSQVTLSSLGNQTRLLLEEQARHLLNEQERATMAYYLDEYRGGSVSVEALVMALFELLNTHAKVIRAPPWARRRLPRALPPPCVPHSFPAHPQRVRRKWPWAENGYQGAPVPGKAAPRLLGKSSMEVPCDVGPSNVAVDTEHTSRIVGIALKSDARASPRACAGHTSVGGSLPQAAGAGRFESQAGGGLGSRSCTKEEGIKPLESRGVWEGLIEEAGYVEKEGRPFRVGGQPRASRSVRGAAVVCTG